MESISIEEFKDLIKKSQNIVFFGGAGVSTASNIPDFRSSKGLYSEKNNFHYPPETILSHSFFMNNTEEFYKFYKSKMLYPDAKPNFAHFALAKLEKEKKLSAIITQNIDNLHQKAGSNTVYELHGSVYRNICMDCGKKYGLDIIMNSNGIPKCTLCGGVIKPDVVLYGENLDDEIVYNSIDSIKKCDTFVIGGSSLTVYPAAGLINYYQGNNLILINKTPTAFDTKAKTLYGDISKIFKEAILDQ